MRDQGIEIDTLSEHLHQTTDPEAPIPSKSEDPSGFMSPLIHAVVSKLKEISPTKQDTQALRELQLVQKKLKETEEKLRQSQKSQRTPSLPEVETPLPNSAVGSQDTEEDPIEPFEDTHPTAAPSKKRRTTAAALGASPKAKTQRGLEACGKFEILHLQAVFASDSLVYNHDATSFPAILIQVRKVQIEFTHWFYFMEQKASQSQTVTEQFGKSKKVSSTGHCAVVCESNSVPKRSKI